MTEAFDAACEKLGELLTGEKVDPRWLSAGRGRPRTKGLDQSMPIADDIRGMKPG